MIENWIDLVVDAVRSIDGIWAPYVFKKAEFPESLTKFPTALTFVEDVAMDYPDRGPNRDFWNGMTEFHLMANTSKDNYPMIMRYYSRIRTVFLQKRLLADNVILKLRSENGPSIEGPVVLQWGSEQPHLGLVAHWIVRERYS